MNPIISHYHLYVSNVSSRLSVLSFRVSRPPAPWCRISHWREAAASRYQSPLLHCCPSRWSLEEWSKSPHLHGSKVPWALPRECFWSFPSVEPRPCWISCDSTPLGWPKGWSWFYHDPLCRHPTAPPHLPAQPVQRRPSRPGAGSPARMPEVPENRVGEEVS